MPRWTESSRRRRKGQSQDNAWNAKFEVLAEDVLCNVMIVRRAQDKDREDVGALYAQLAVFHAGLSTGMELFNPLPDAEALLRASEYPSIIKSDDECMVVAEGEDGGVKGMAHFIMSEPPEGGQPLPYLEKIAVDQSCRGRGIGASLLQSFYGWAAGKQYAVTSLDVMRANRAASLYERQGFKIRTVIADKDASYGARPLPPGYVLREARDDAGWSASDLGAAFNVAAEDVYVLERIGTPVAAAGMQMMHPRSPDRRPLDVAMIAGFCVSRHERNPGEAGRVLFDALSLQAFRMKEPDAGAITLRASFRPGGRTEDILVRSGFAPFRDFRIRQAPGAVPDEKPALA